jgi:hypothetical protein
MRRSMARITVRVKRLAAQRKDGAAANDWDRYVAILRSARTERPQRVKLTPEEFAGGVSGFELLCEGRFKPSLQSD